MIKPPENSSGIHKVQTPGVFAWGCSFANSPGGATGPLQPTRSREFEGCAKAVGIEAL